MFLHVVGFDDIVLARSNVFVSNPGNSSDFPGWENFTNLWKSRVC